MHGPPGASVVRPVGDWSPAPGSSSAGEQVAGAAAAAAGAGGSSSPVSKHQNKVHHATLPDLSVQLQAPPSPSGGASPQVDFDSPRVLSPSSTIESAPQQAAAVEGHMKPNELQARPPEGTSPTHVASHLRDEEASQRDFRFRHSQRNSTESTSDSTPSWDGSTPIVTPKPVGHQLSNRNSSSEASVASVSTPMATRHLTPAQLAHRRADGTRERITLRLSSPHPLTTTLAPLPAVELLPLKPSPPIESPASEMLAPPSAAASSSSANSPLSCASDRTDMRSVGDAAPNSPMVSMVLPAPQEESISPQAYSPVAATRSLDPVGVNAESNHSGEDANKNQFPRIGSFPQEESMWSCWLPKMQQPIASSRLPGKNNGGGGDGDGGDQPGKDDTATVSFDGSNRVGDLDSDRDRCPPCMRRTLCGVRVIGWIAMFLCIAIGVVVVYATQLYMGDLISKLRDARFQAGCFDQTTLLARDLSALFAKQPTIAKTIGIVAANPLSLEGQEAAITKSVARSRGASRCACTVC
jgi:hypothetical protein